MCGDSVHLDVLGLHHPSQQGGSDVAVDAASLLNVVVAVNDMVFATIVGLCC